MAINVKVSGNTHTLLESEDLSVTDTSKTSMLTVRAVTVGNLVLYRCAGYPSSVMTANTEYTIATGVKPAIASVTHFFPQSASSSGLVVRVSVSPTGDVTVRPSQAVSTSTGINFEIVLPKSL